MLRIVHHPGLAAQHEALVLGGKLRGEDMSVPHHAERHPIFAGQTTPFPPLGSAMEIDRILPVPHEIDRNGVRIPVLAQGLHAVFPLAE